MGYDAGKKVKGRKIPALRVEIVKRTADMIGFVVLPRRWVSSARSPGSGETALAEDYENLAQTLLAFVTLASIQLALRRLSKTYDFESGS